MKEFWELFDKDGNSLNIKHPLGEKIPTGCYHKVSEIFVKISGEGLFMTKRHPAKFLGGLWEASGGSALFGEDVTDCAVRELFEETGISAGRDELCFLGVHKNSDCLVYSYLLSLEVLPELNLDKNEVVGWRVTKFEDFDSIFCEMTPGVRERFALYKEKITNE